jgi:hypothetical protein
MVNENLFIAALGKHFLRAAGRLTPIQDAEALSEILCALLVYYFAFRAVQKPISRLLKRQIAFTRSATLK